MPYVENRSCKCKSCVALMNAEFDAIVKGVEFAPPQLMAPVQSDWEWHDELVERINQYTYGKHNKRR